VVDSTNHVDDGIPRVLFAIGTLGIGGSENQLTEFLVRAHPDQLRATVVTWRAPELDLPNEQRLMNADVDRQWLLSARTSRPLSGLVASWKINHVLHRCKPDVVYCWLEHASLFFGPLARLHRIPLIVDVDAISYGRLFSSSASARERDRRSMRENALHVVLLHKIGQRLKVKAWTSQEARPLGSNAVDY